MKKEGKVVEQKKYSKAKAEEQGFLRGIYNALLKKTKQNKLFMIVWILLMMVWVAAVLFAVQYLVGIFFVYALNLSASQLNSNVTQALFSAIVYVISLALIIFVPWAAIKVGTTRDELGLRGLLTWKDILFAIGGFVVAIIGASLLLGVFSEIIPTIDWEQQQDVGFSNLTSGTGDFVLAFILLVVVAPVVEEIIFRGWLYGKMRARVSAIWAILAVSLLFGIVHLQWNVGVTVFVMSVVMCAIRELTGTIWSGILIHILKNGFAFYFLFVNPMMLQ